MNFEFMEQLGRGRNVIIIYPNYRLVADGLLDISEFIEPDSYSRSQQKLVYDSNFLHGVSIYSEPSKYMGSKNTFVLFDTLIETFPFSWRDTEMLSRHKHQVPYANSRLK